MTVPRAVTPDVVPVLLPPSSDLSEAELCGRDCTWCGAHLLGRASVDLGERDDESGRRIFPRACPKCAVLTAYHQLINHVAACAGCVEGGSYCSESAEMRRAWNEGRRL